MRFEFHFFETHHSTIPLFHHSNWGKAPKFKSIRAVYTIHLAKSVSRIGAVVKTALFYL